MKRTFLIFISFLSFAAVSHAQIGNRLLRTVTNQAINSVENRANKEIEKKVDESVNKAIDNMLESDSIEKKDNAIENEAQSGTQNKTSDDESAAKVARLMKSFGVSTDIPKHKDDYKFTSQMVTLNESTDDKGTKIDPVESYISYNENNSDVLFKVNDRNNSSITIMDHENKCILVLTESEGQKSGIVTKFDPEKMAQKLSDLPTENNVEEEVVEDECKMVKTGKTKTISGFSCAEHRCETSDEIFVAWITKDRSANLNNIFRNNEWGSNFKTEGFDGMAIRYETYSKSNKSSSIMTITSFDNKKSSSFSLSGYTLSGFNLNTSK